ncbi:MAG: hypothetical protein KGL39_24865 [Patescibacteria group bacterium]|nr:hypothetical protein [Patescibacteria group bacterium]
MSDAIKTEIRKTPLRHRLQACRQVIQDVLRDGYTLNAEDILIMDVTLEEAAEALQAENACPKAIDIASTF